MDWFSKIETPRAFPNTGWSSPKKMLTQHLISHPSCPHFMSMVRLHLSSTLSNGAVAHFFPCWMVCTPPSYYYFFFMPPNSHFPLCAKKYFFSLGATTPSSLIWCCQFFFWWMHASSKLLLPCGCKSFSFSMVLGSSIFQTTFFPFSLFLEHNSTFCPHTCCTIPFSLAKTNLLNLLPIIILLTPLAWIWHLTSLKIIFLFPQSCGLHFFLERNPTTCLHHDLKWSEHLPIHPEPLFPLFIFSNVD